MFPKDVPERFSREMGLTEADWNRSLPGAAGRHPLTLPAPGRARLQLPEGAALTLRWQVLPPRQIALARLPRLQVDFEFIDTSPAARTDFMQGFDRFMQRGGG